MENQKLSPEKKIKGLGFTVGDFWAWAYSDVLCNTNRCALAEFLVAAALGVVKAPRIEWESVDLQYGAKKIEVKCSAYLQSWEQTGLSRIKFDIAKKKQLDKKTNAYSGEPIRPADCYVFCIYGEKDAAKTDSILEVESWEFYVLAKEEIGRPFGNQKSVGIEAIRRGCKPVGYGLLKSTVDSVLGVE